MNILNSISKDEQCFTSWNKQYHTVHGFIDKERKQGDKSNPFREQNKKGGSKETIKVVAAEQCIKQGRHSGNGSWEEQSAVQQRWGTVYDASINTYCVSHTGSCTAAGVPRLLCLLVVEKQVCF